MLVILGACEICPASRPSEKGFKVPEFRVLGFGVFR